MVNAPSSLTFHYFIRYSRVLYPFVGQQGARSIAVKISCLQSSRIVQLKHGNLRVLYFRREAKFLLTNSFS